MNEPSDLKNDWPDGPANEARDAQGLPPVPWGDKPWLPSNQVQPR